MVRNFYVAKVLSPCTSRSDTICGCMTGYHFIKDHGGNGHGYCQLNQMCSVGYGLVENGKFWFVENTYGNNLFVLFKNMECFRHIFHFTNSLFHFTKSVFANWSGLLYSITNIVRLVSMFLTCIYWLKINVNHNIWCFFLCFLQSQNYRPTNESIMSLCLNSSNRKCETCLPSLTKNSMTSSECCYDFIDLVHLSNI